MRLCWAPPGHIGDFISRKANSRIVTAIRQPNLFNMAHCFVLSLATVGSGAFEALVQEFLKDDQQEFIFPTTKKENMVVEKNSYQQRITEVKVPRSKRRGN
jgi:hypothetical protein